MSHPAVRKRKMKLCVQINRREEIREKRLSGEQPSSPQSPAKASRTRRRH